MTHGRNKGNGAEREVAKLIETWWQQVEPGCKFVRTPLSGGWGGPALRGEFRAAADLMTTAQSFPYAVEVKRRERWTMKSLAGGKPSPVWDWWRQTQKASAEMNAIPLLWLRKNREPWRVMMPVEHPCSGTFGLSWSKRELLGVDVGSHHPILYLAESLLSTPPGLIIASLRAPKARRAPLPRPGLQTVTTRRIHGTEEQRGSGSEEGEPRSGDQHGAAAQQGARSLEEG